MDGSSVGLELIRGCRRPDLTMDSFGRQWIRFGDLRDGQEPGPMAEEGALRIVG